MAEEQTDQEKDSDTWWESDMQYKSMALDRKREASVNLQKYLDATPEVRAISSDFIKHLLIFKPENVFDEAASYFKQFKS
eukprot:m.15533 g.15533  ORF g.15533 m.15533 type:complete len:80 (-) comp10627_c1_seq1:458-697(-)